jgi:hypothetical protein
MLASNDAPANPRDHREGCYDLIEPPVDGAFEVAPPAITMRFHAGVIMSRSGGRCISLLKCLSRFVQVSAQHGCRPVSS